MNDASNGQRTQPETDQEQLECLLAEAREILEMTSTPGWRSFFDPLQQTAMDAARRMRNEEDPVAFFRCQATLAFAQRLVDLLRRPFEAVKRLDPGHPMARQDLPCAAAFDEALAHYFNLHGNADVMMENDCRSRAAQLLLRSFALLNRHGRTEENELDAGVEGDGDVERMVHPGRTPAAEGAGSLEGPSGSKPGSRKLKHPWRASYLDRT